MGKDFKFGIRDIIAIREGAIQTLVALSPRCRLEGMVTDLTESDKLAIAWTGSVMMHLNRVGITPPELTQGFFPEPYTAVQEVIDDDTCSISTKGA